MKDKSAANNHHLVLAALGEDQTGLVDELSRSILQSGCTISDSRMAVLGGDFALLLQVAGNWNNIAKLEDQLPGLEERLGLTINAHRTRERSGGQDAHTGTPMFSVHLTVEIPATLQISALREEFMEFCDQLNLDAVIEPVKG
jgi:glycine cleavage system transcriptional repressor